MRSDFHKVVSRRSKETWGNDLGSTKMRIKVTASRDLSVYSDKLEEQSPSRVAVRPKVWLGYGYSKNSIIRNFLRSRVGQPWDKVFSEFAFVFGNASPYYRLEAMPSALYFIVTPKPFFDDEGVPYCTRHGIRIPIREDRFYVDEAGILRNGPAANRAEANARKRRGRREADLRAGKGFPLNEFREIRFADGEYWMFAVKPSSNAERARFESMKKRDHNRSYFNSGWLDRRVSVPSVYIKLRRATAAEVEKVLNG